MSSKSKGCLKFAAAGLIASAGFWWLFVVSFGYFFFKIFNDRRGIKFTLTDGFIYWLSFFVGSLHWLVFPLTIDLKTHGILIPFALVAIPAYLSAQLLLHIYIVKKWVHGLCSSTFAFAFLNFAGMYFYGHCAPGFPWVLPGYFWNDSVISMQTLSLWGIYGQTFITLLLGCACGAAYHRYKIRKSFVPILVCVGAVIAFIYCFGFFRLQSHPTGYTRYKVRTIQASISQKDKMKKNLAADNLNLHLNLSKLPFDGKAADIIIWPEASIPFLYRDSSQYLNEKLSTVAPKDGCLVCGVVRKDSATRKIYNSAIIVDEFGRKIGKYDKRRLVPFGEYLPFRRFIPKVFAPIANSIGDFDIGESNKSVCVKGLKITFAICYEIIFPREFIERNEDVDVILNITNDAWFGHTIELNQHLQISRARAVEEGVPLIRATNFGISAVFDACGREIKSLKVDEVGVLDCRIPKRIEKTFYGKVFSFFQNSL